MYWLQVFQWKGKYVRKSVIVGTNLDLKLWPGYLHLWASVSLLKNVKGGLDWLFSIEEIPQMESWEQAVVWVGYNSGFSISASTRAAACFICLIYWGSY